MSFNWTEQQQRNQQLIAPSPYLGSAITSRPLPLRLHPGSLLTSGQQDTVEALQIEAARIALKTLAALAEINELDHLGGGLDLIPAFTLTRAFADDVRVHYTFEHAHTSVGYYAVLAAYEFLQADDVILRFRRSLDMAGHVAWLPGGTPLNGGRLGVMIPTAVGQALGLRAQYGEHAWVICHTGDAGWISGQALNGFNAADLHRAPISFVMHRNGIQLSNTNRAVMDKDPRPIIAAMGVEVLEIPSLLDTPKLHAAYVHAQQQAQAGQPTLIYPVGEQGVTLQTVGASLGIAKEMAQFASQHQVALETPVWLPGSLMSYRDVECMLECIFYVNNLPGGKGHHDGHMKGRSLENVLANPMLQHTPEQRAALDSLRQATRTEVITRARPPAGHPNLQVEDAEVTQVSLPAPGKAVSPRAGVEAGYALIARKYPEQTFVVSCDLDPSTKLEKARTFLPPDNQYEMSIQEQASAMLANGLAMANMERQLVVFSTFAAFFEGIAREGCEMWRYQRNLNGVNEGLNVTYHMSHVGACTGRDHFSGWALDWITIALGYLPYLHRFYAPADARSAFIAVRDLAAHYGGHMIGIPRDNLPVLTLQNGDAPLWQATDAWTPITPYRQFKGARKTILAIGAPAYLAGEAADRLQDTDALICNGLPLASGELEHLFETYPDGIVTVEDGLIATPDTGGLRGFAGLVASAAYGRGVPLRHIGIVDPRIAPSNGHLETWAHFGITTEALLHAVKALDG